MFVYRIVNRDGHPWCGRKLGFNEFVKFEVFDTQLEAEAHIGTMPETQFDEKPRVQWTVVGWSESTGQPLTTPE